MGLSKHFPRSPFEIIEPNHRWFPADDELEDKKDNLLPPLVPQVREEVKIWRDRGYPGLSNTTRSLLRFWFETEHPIGDNKFFNYYFSQRESVESVIYIYEVKGCRIPTDLLPFDRTHRIDPQMFEENWLRLVCKQATGSGKTKVLSLLLTWCYFHKKYEEESDLSTNFLFITPNIIVLDRIRTDFDGLRIFNEDPLIPENGFEGKFWKSDFNLTLHIQDEIRPINPNGNIFLTNIHRVYEKKKTESTFEDENLTDYFLGEKPVTNTKDDKFNLSELIRDINDLVVLNDEAHHIHDSSLSWFTSIQDIHNNLIQKGTKLSLQLDVTATPKHTNGNIFVQTISDYPLVEAISQGVVKTPVLPDETSRSRFKEKNVIEFAEKYSDYLELGYIEWRKSFEEHKKLGKKSVMFIMVDDTKNCDGVKDYLEFKYPELKGEVFVIHTKRNGEISEAQGGKKEVELQELREIANTIDSNKNPYKVIVSVLMLKEGWDVKNVTTIVGLRAYSSKSNILPEQTLGRGLRRMYFGNDDIQEKVSVVGTEQFLDFVESIKSEGVILEKSSMGGKNTIGPSVIEVDNNNDSKNLVELDIVIPVLKGKIQRNHKNLGELDLDKIEFTQQKIVEFSEEEKRQIVFRDITEGELSHITQLDREFDVDVNSLIRYFTKSIFKDLRLFGGQELLYGKVKSFIKTYLFGKTINLEDKNVLRNLVEPYINNEIKDSFKKAINELSLTQEGETVILDELKVGNTKPFLVKESNYIRPKKSMFNKIVGDSEFELQFASFLENCIDVKSFIKCFKQINFKIEYINSDGNPSVYYPDFVVKLNDNTHYVIETKGDGFVNQDVKLKFERLKTWCSDATEHTKENWKPLYVLQSKWNSLSEKPSSFLTLNQLFN